MRGVIPLLISQGFLCLGNQFRRVILCEFPLLIVEQLLLPVTQIHCFSSGPVRLFPGLLLVTVTVQILLPQTVRLVPCTVGVTSRAHVDGGPPAGAAALHIFGVGGVVFSQR